MPLECVAITCAAQNQVVSGNFDRCIAVPAVSEVCRPQSRHSNRRGRLFKATARPLPHAGQTNPSGQRRAKRTQRSAPRQEILSGTPPPCVRAPPLRAPNRRGLKRAQLHTLHIAEPVSKG